MGAENVLAGIMEGVGRVASEIVERKNKKVTAAVLSSIARFLQPGDVIITRHAKALTNLFMPGFWPHAALYIGQHPRRRKILSAENLLDFALDSSAFTPVAIFGVEGCRDAVMFGEAVRGTLVASYRDVSSFDQ